MLGCRPPGRNTEQHDIFFGMGNTVRDLIPDIKKFWQGAGKIHVDAWREVTTVDNYTITVVPRQSEVVADDEPKLYFLNLGGYREGEFDEFHYKMLVVAASKAEAVKVAKKSAFYKHTGFKGAPSHIDDKFGVDVDEMHEVEDILSDELKANYKLQITAANGSEPDALYLGYFTFDKL